MPEKDQEEQGQQANEALRKSLPVGVKLMGTLRGHKSWIGRIAWSPDGRTVASPSGDGTVRLWDSQTGSEIKIIAAHKGWVYSVAFDCTGTKLVSTGWDGTARLWDISTGETLRKVKTRGHEVRAVAFHPSGIIALGSDNVKVWDLSNNKVLHYGFRTPVLALAFSPSSSTLAIACEDSTLEILGITTSRRSSLEGHRSAVLSVAFDPSGATLATGSDDKTVKLWNVTTGKVVRTLEAHKGNVVAVAFSWDGRLLASKGTDNAIRIWSVGTGALLASIPAPASDRRTPGLAFHPSLPLLATVGSDMGVPDKMRDRIIHLFELDPSALATRAGTFSVSCTSAKIVLVGESNVGKSYLAHRIVTGSPPPEGVIKSTHGMKFWPLEPERLSSSAKAPLGQRRDVVMWDMGGQEEYRLIHQLFLHDTTVALMLFDPTRGAAAFKEVETWNKSLERQLRGRGAVKLLIGAKLDQSSDTIDVQGVDRLVRDYGFAGYYETSAITGRGVKELCEATANVIDWEGLGKTSRPQLFQAIRDEIEARRVSGTVVILFDDLNAELQTNEASEVYSLLQHEVAMASDAEAGTEALDAVCCQLAQQGIIVDARTSGGKRALLLRVEEVERYAGSLILAARHNSRGVPALELKAIGQSEFKLPGIARSERLPPNHERTVLECTVQLMLEHGICFQHEGLLIFPSLFASTGQPSDAKLPHAVSLYYDFAGAIDNIYASLVAWLVLAQDFGRVRLWSDRAEFEVHDRGICGLRKVGRAGGFAHVDVYFETETSSSLRTEFISFVEDHLARNGVEIREHVAIKCSCDHEFAEETLRQRIARGDKDVICPVCEKRHSLTEGAAEARERDPKLSQHTWALRTQIEKLRERITKQVVNVLGKAESSLKAGPIRLLHLSDLHFTATTPVKARLQWLLDDLKRDLGFKELDYLVISGDFTDRGCPQGFDTAYEFVSELARAFGLSAERCIFVPGNHDIVDLQEAYDWRKKVDGLRDGEWVKQGDIILVRNPAKYPLRFKPFSDAFYHKFLQRPYPSNYAEQGIAIPFWETGIQFVTLNSCWQVDEFNRKRSGVLPEAVASVLKQAQQQEEHARKSGVLPIDRPLLRIAVWHHSVTGPEQMKDVGFLGNLQKNGVRIALHGDVHAMNRELVGYWHDKQLHVIGSGSFGARSEDRPESTARLYNVLEIARDLKSAVVHTRRQPKEDGPWDGWHEWPHPNGREGRVPYYKIEW
jgi:small GTP-binding protein